jgi:esterase/lipase
MREYDGMNKPLKEIYVICLQLGELFFYQIKEGYKLGKLVSLTISRNSESWKNNRRENMLLCL